MIKDIVHLQNRNIFWKQNADQMNQSINIAKLNVRKSAMKKSGHDLYAVFLSDDLLYCRWSLAPSTLKAAFHCGKPLNSEILDLRIFDITDIYFNGVNAHSVTCIKVSKDDQFWTIKGLKRNRSYICELGFLTEDYRFFPILQSHPIHTPFQSTEDYVQRLPDVEQYYQLPACFLPWIEHPDAVVDS
ncbi:DUF4912 domain-containing protein [Domibacillus epiphyticus]|uniref:DUF4912 domain-containing protein n=1 Tax=Domibacillus epiphyticus TaxID=1714355 RepID=A0A1V2A9J7_9BACI|nr:DUF4912 domain-containing protein [Domibacillus epiphyticus]OMP67675.1 hypothetical protein BTO28_06955 [Domibacillus epiphyticus]